MEMKKPDVVVIAKTIYILLTCFNAILPIFRLKVCRLKKIGLVCCA